jgi:hypothetical protein
MPQSVIDRVNTLAGDQPQLLTFTDRHGNAIGDADVSPQPEISHKIPGVVEDAVAIPGVDMAVETKSSEYDHNDIPPEPPLLDPTNNHTNDQPSFDTQPIEFEAATEKEDNIPPTPPAAAETVSATEAPTNIPTPPRRSSRIKTKSTSYVPTMKGKSYQYSALQLAEVEWDSEVVELIFTQLTLKAALKTWGNDAKVAAKSEMKQLHWRNSFKPVHFRDLTA